MSTLNTLSDIYTNITGPSAVIMAIMMYSKWVRDMWASRNILTFAVCAILVVLTAADILERAPSWLENEPTIITVKKISNRVVVLDGYDYEHCEFTNVRFEYNGGLSRFQNNVIHGSVHLTSKNKYVNAAVIWFGLMGLSKIPLLDKNGKPIEPGVIWQN
jgi:hypothetical protein